MKKRWLVKFRHIRTCYLFFFSFFMSFEIFWNNFLFRSFVLPVEQHSCLMHSSYENFFGMINHSRAIQWVALVNLSIIRQIVHWPNWINWILWIRMQMKWWTCKLIYTGPLSECVWWESCFIVVDGHRIFFVFTTASHHQFDESIFLELSEWN